MKPESICSLEQLQRRDNAGSLVVMCYMLQYECQIGMKLVGLAIAGSRNGQFKGFRVQQQHHTAFNISSLTICAK